MPKRNDIKKILLPGGGPVVIGQGAEVDYAACAAVDALRADGFEVVVADSNPAALALDGASTAYIEPLTADSISSIIEKEKPDAVLPTFGGQNALNISSKLKCEILGVGGGAIDRAGDGKLFRETMDSASISIPRGGIATSIEEGMSIIRQLGFPAFIKPAYAAGGAGSAVVYNIEEFWGMLAKALEAGPVRQAIIEESVLGWKEVELIVLRDSADAVSTVASIENIGPAGVHSGDSIVVTPAQTLSQDILAKLSQIAAKAVRAIGIVGLANVQFAIERSGGDIRLIEVNPRANRSISLAGKATGINIAAIAAKLSVGYTLAEIDMIEPDSSSIAVRVPRFAFDKFPTADTLLGTSMKSLGAAMGVGRSFAEAVQKAIRSLETGRAGLGADGAEIACEDSDALREMLARPNSDRLFYIRCALANGMDAQAVADASFIDVRFVQQIRSLIDFEASITGKSLVSVPAKTITDAKALGYSDAQLAHLLETEEEQVRMRRKVLGIAPGYQSIGSCRYSTYSGSGEDIKPSGGKRVLILGSGPNRIGAGSEFDYNVATAIAALRADGYETILVNPNPDSAATADRIYIEPLTHENVLDMIAYEKPDAVIATLGGPTALRLAASLKKAAIDVRGVPEKGVDPKHIDKLISSLGLKRLQNSGGASIEEFLEDAIDVSVDVICDGATAVVCGIMEHIERGGISTGDSAASIPPYSLPDSIVDEVKDAARKIAIALGGRGLIGARFAIKGGEVYLIEIEPSATASIAFVSRATGVEWAAVAAKVILGKSLNEAGISGEIAPKCVSVKEVVFPFVRLPELDVVLGPEMKSTGGVMGIDSSFGSAYIKAQIAADQNLPQGGTAFVSVAQRDKCEIAQISKGLIDIGFKLVATRGTARVLREAGVEVTVIPKLGEGRPDAIDLIKNEQIDLIINTPSGARPRRHEVNIRSAVVARGIPIITTTAGAKATLHGMQTVRQNGPTVRSLAEYRG